MSDDTQTAEEHTFAEELAPTEHSEYLALEDLDEVTMQVSAELGRTRLHVREILELGKGSVVPLDKLAGEMADVRVNEILVGKAEVVVIGDNINVRIAEIYGMESEA